MGSSIWKAEFGAAYRVPKAIERMFDAGEVADSSWHNDLAPSFGREDVGSGFEVRIWIEHPDPAQRELQEGKRFTVSVYEENADGPADKVDLDGYEFDRVQDAITKFRKLVKKYTKRRSP